MFKLNAFLFKIVHKTFLYTFNFLYFFYEKNPNTILEKILKEVHTILFKITNYGKRKKYYVKK